MLRSTGPAFELDKLGNCSHNNTIRCFVRQVLPVMPSTGKADYSGEEAEDEEQHSSSTVAVA